jgi:glucosamine-6-phosphate deaminase
MKLLKTKNYKGMSEKAAEMIIKEINKKPNLVLGFATGKTALGLYKNLIGAYKKRKLDFSKIRAFALDEYYPIKKTDKKSFYYYLHKNLFDKINIKKENINLLNGETKNLRGECWDYEKKIKKSPIDLQILGIGVNGHVAFNEPGSLKESRTRLVELTSKTKKINKTNKKALTIGISTIMSAKKIILLASGKKKAEAIKHLIQDKENKKWPVTYLRNHKNLIVIIDKKAGKLI